MTTKKTYQASDSIATYIRAKDGNRPHLMEAAFTSDARLASPPDGPRPSFSCDWLVGMSEKGSGAVRIGCGRYDWSFRPPALVLVGNLRITIELMQSLPAHACPGVMAWLAQLPYPWCKAEAALESMPRLEALRAVADHLARVGDNTEIQL